MHPEAQPTQQVLPLSNAVDTSTELEAVQDNYVSHILKTTEPLPPVTASNWWKELNHLNIAILGLPHIITLYGLFTTRLRPQTAIFAVAYYFFTCLGASNGLLWSHIGWLIVKPRRKPGPADASDLSRSAVVRWQHRYYVWLLVLMGVVVPTLACGLLWGDWRGGTFCVNSLAHYLGETPFDDKNTPRDHFFTALVTVGEGYHNFHHQFPMDYRNAIKLPCFSKLCYSNTNACSSRDSETGYITLNIFWSKSLREEGVWSLARNSATAIQSCRLGVIKFHEDVCQLPLQVDPSSVRELWLVCVQDNLLYRSACPVGDIQQAPPREADRRLPAYKFNLTVPCEMLCCSTARDSDDMMRGDKNGILARKVGSMPRSAALVEWYQYDPTKWLIWVCSKVGLASHLKVFPDNEVAKGQLTMQLKRLREKQDGLQWPEDVSNLPIVSWQSFQKQAESRSLVLIAGFIHDVASFIDEHPGGRHLIVKYIGRDATAAFFGGIYDHSNAAHNLLSMKRVGILSGGHPHGLEDRSVPPSQRLRVARLDELSSPYSSTEAEGEGLLD
ncbi:hypothetical protein BV25DRAFT_1902258 [Artomyces pyxidatus]|uniref:Uncharacterized protein n=1 Tax=Artomyces pyxidatus TaxID=48021 RepID=A0ACB8SNJ6_9AGAM|nr:hypothetical protein BV25DRAFT_1902258 [Artomyces pyxidatus]